MNDNEHSEIFSDEKSEDTTGALIIAHSTGIDTESDSHVSNAEQPNIATLTAEIKMYLHIANQSIIEVGKRLIQAKEMLPHGDWYNWLKNNFNLTVKMANNFMRVAERFDSNRNSNSDFDISTFNQSQLIALLALPEGDEEKFIAEKAAEGNPADQMTIKQLRAEINKFKKDNEYLEKKTSHFEKRVEETIFEMEKYRRQSEYLTKVADALQEQSDEYKAKLEQRPTVEVPPPDYEDLQREVKELRDRPIDVATEFPPDYESTKYELAELKARELSFKHDYALAQTLHQLFSLVHTLIHADNLKNVVNICADEGLENLEYQLSQLLSLHDTILNYVTDLENDPINKRPIDRDAIIAELKQIMLQDPSTRTSSKIEDLISSLGYKKLLDIPDELLPDLLKKVRTF